MTDSRKKEEPIIFEKTREGRTGVMPADPDVPICFDIPNGRLRGEGSLDGFPEVSELDVVRHFTRLSQKNFGLDAGFYPLGSCTMKYNPKVNEDISRLKGFTDIHPFAPDRLQQGALELMYELEQYLSEISGMDAVTLDPSAGAHGELCGLLIIAEHFRKRPRKKVLIPDTAHGTNPASANLAGFEVVPIKTEGRGVLTVEAVREKMDRDCAALMVTNPNTLGLFERNIKGIAEVVHKKGGLLYCDGANLNALMGIVRLGDIGVDIVQMNLHKTFSTPHGGGGPGSGPVGVKRHLKKYLPAPRIRKRGARFSLDFDQPSSIGMMKAFYGNFAIMVRAYSYIRRLGRDGLRRASEIAILNANYIKEGLKGSYHLPFDEVCMHEAVFSDRFQTDSGITTLDIAKRLIDYGFHPPTIYFPLVVHGAIMIEPTETESLETIDEFIVALKAIAEEARKDPKALKDAPFSTPVGRVDETRAAREPVLRWLAEAKEG